MYTKSPLLSGGYHAQQDSIETRVLQERVYDDEVRAQVKGHAAGASGKEKKQRD